jgi:hypothetical protein
MLRSNDFARKYHWPDGVPLNPTDFLNDVQAAAPGKFCVDEVEDLGHSKTLRSLAIRR